MKNIFYIAEVGINHNGDLKICKELISLAKKAGFHAVKFQKRDIDLVYKKEMLDSLRESPWGKTQREQKLGLEFTEKEYDEIDKYCKELKILWFASAWDINSVEFLKKYDLKYNKIASAMIVDKVFLKKIAQQKKHTFISTGMCNISDIEEAVKIFRDENCPFELMHCVSTYPMETEDANLNIINLLKDKFKCDVGYSGHESGLAVSFAAATMNITSLERHITLNRSMYGSDQSASLEPNGFSFLISTIEKMKLSFGISEKKFEKKEQEIALKLRSHIKI